MSTEPPTEPTGWTLSPHAVQQIFEQRVAELPDAVAIETPAGPWSYRDVNTYANRVANLLRSSGVAPGEFVAVSALRSPETIAALLGVAKVGAAYVALDSSYPDERLRFMLEDTKTRCLLADEVCAKRLAGNLPKGCSILRLDGVAGLVAEQSPEAVSYSGDPSDLLCIIYTSGSTGTPKGVMIEHRGVTRLVVQPDFVTIRREEVFAHLAPLSFDTSLFEIFGALLNGARVLVLPASVTELPRVAEAIQRFQVTTMWLTSGLFSAMIDECPQFVRHLRQLVVGGDVVSVSHARKACEQMTEGCLINGYGPTENTTFSTAHRVVPADLSLAAIPIGRAIQGSGAYILDENLKPVEGSQEGEIYVTGDGLARGYWNLPDLTNARFSEIEAIPGKPERAYKTGDLARYRPDGTIDFIGRMDTQVKIRGYRIELTEIENAIADYEPVATAVAVAVTAGGLEEKHLRLCCVLKNGRQLSASEAERFLRRKLPAYLIPSEYVQVSKIPLDPNGKVDRRALARMEASGTARPAVSSPAGLSPVESELLSMLRDLLRSSKISVDDDFFLVGGHSLLAARLFAQIEARFGRRLPLALMLELRTIRNLAGVIEASDHSPAWSSLVPLRKEGAGIPVFLLHAIGGNVIGYRELALLLPENLPVYGIQAQGLDGVTQMPDTLEQMAALYVEQIRSVQSKGPYYLCGFSAGGMMAFEVTRQLEKAGERVGLIGLIDSNLNASLAAIARGQGLWAAIVQASHVLRWNLWYSTQIGLGNFLSKKFRNSRLNLRIALSALLRKMAFGRAGQEVQLTVEEAFIRAIRRYDAEWVAAKAILFRTHDSALYDPNQEAAWRRSIKGGLQVCTVSGTHDTMLESPNLEMLVSEFVAAMENTKASGTSGSYPSARTAGRDSYALGIPTAVGRGALR